MSILGQIMPLNFVKLSAPHRAIDSMRVDARKAKKDKVRWKEKQIIELFECITPP